MANPDHIKIVQTGPSKFKEWREKNPRVQLELDYEVYNRLWLQFVNMDNTNCYGTWIGFSDINEVSLINADFRDSTVYVSGFYNCNLSKANFADGRFWFSTLKNCHLAKTDLTKAKLRDTNLLGCDLSKCIGLSTIEHETATSIDIETLIKSFKGSGNCFTQELQAFFIKAGVQKEFLDNMPKIIGKD